MSASWSNGNAFLFRVGAPKFKSLADQIGHSVKSDTVDDQIGHRGDGQRLCCPGANNLFLSAVLLYYSQTKQSIDFY